MCTHYSFGVMHDGEERKKGRREGDERGKDEGRETREERMKGGRKEKW